MEKTQFTNFSPPSLPGCTCQDKTGFWSVRQLPFMRMNINRNSNKTLRGLRWNGFSHVCVECSVQTHSYPPQHSNLLWIAPHSQHNEHLRHLIHTPSFSHYTEFKFYRDYALTWLKAQRNGLSLPNSSFLSLSYTNYKTAVPLLSVKGALEMNKI